MGLEERRLGRRRTEGSEESKEKKGKKKIMEMEENIHSQKKD